MTPAIQQTIIHPYIDRGPWGKSDFRGNVSGHLVNDLLDTYQPTMLLDPMEGSGTSRDVARDRALPYLGYDLSSGTDLLNLNDRVRMRKDITALLTPDAPDYSQFDGKVPFIFWHPPYWNMVKYHASDPRDLSSMRYGMYIAKMQNCLEFLGSLLDTYGRIVFLMGDFRSSEGYKWITRDTLTPSAVAGAGLVLEVMMIREQYNVSSENTEYGPGTIRMIHEYVAVLQRRPRVRGGLQ